MTKYVVAIVSENQKYYYAGGMGLSSGGSLTLTKEFGDAIKFSSHGAAVQAGLAVEFDLKTLGKYEGSKVICEEINNKETIWEKIQQMSKEEFAEWLYANCEWISAEYGACSGANDESSILELLNTVEDSF